MRYFVRGCVVCLVFNETTARMESGFSMVTNQSDRYVGTYTSSWSLLQLRANRFWRRYDSTHCLWRYVLPLFRDFS